MKIDTDQSTNDRISMSKFDLHPVHTKELNMFN